MNKTLLVTRPMYDDCTEYLSAYASLVLKEAKKLGVPTKDLSEESANKKEVEKFITKTNTKLFFANGHGNDNQLCGHKNEVIISGDENADLLKNKIIYARACSAGASLGKKAVQNGDGCFIGYAHLFSFWMDGKWSAAPLKDKTAAFYLEPSNEIVIALINGKSSREAHEKSKKMMAKNMKKLLRLEEKQEPSAMGMLQVLWNNYEGQVLHGNKEAYF